MSRGCESAGGEQARHHQCGECGCERAGERTIVVLLVVGSRTVDGVHSSASANRFGALGREGDRRDPCDHRTRLCAATTGCDAATSGSVGGVAPPDGSTVTATTAPSGTACGIGTTAPPFRAENVPAEAGVLPSTTQAW